MENMELLRKKATNVSGLTRTKDMKVFLLKYSWSQSVAVFNQFRTQPRNHASIYNLKNQAAWGKLQAA